MQTTWGTDVYTGQLHKHKHVLTFTAVIEAEVWNLRGAGMRPFPQGHEDCTCVGLNSGHVWFKACSGHYSWHLKASHLILLPYCNNKPRHPLQMVDKVLEDGTHKRRQAEGIFPVSCELKFPWWWIHLLIPMHLQKTLQLKQGLIQGD